MTDPAEERPSSSRSRDVADDAQDPDGSTVMVVEDDPSVAEVLTTALGARNYTVIVTRTGEQALRAVAAGQPDIVLLDLGLPDMDGLEVCRRIRERSTVPVIVLTADGDEQRKVAALDLGADDYVTKPFSTPELLARLRVAQRNRRITASGTGSGAMRLAGIVVDADAHLVTVADERVHLTQKEFALLEVLAGSRNGLVTHRDILDAVWPSGGGSAESLRVHVTNLRRKIGPDAGVEIQTEAGVGYRLVASTAP